METGANNQTWNTVLKSSSRPVSVLLLVGTGLAFLNRLYEWRGQAWTDAVWLLLGLAVTILWCSRNLPLQNSLSAIATLFALGWFIKFVSKVGFHSVAELPGVCMPTQSSLADYAQPMAWAVLLLNARGVARLILSLKGKRPNRGLWTLAVAGILVCVPQLAEWSTIKRGGLSNWHGYVVHIAAWWGFSVFCLALATPALSKRRPGPEFDSIEPVWIWAGFNCLVIVTAVNQKNWVATIFQAAAIAIVAGSAVRGYECRERESLTELRP
jgi:hypothetical protein